MAGSSSAPGAMASERYIVQSVRRLTEITDVLQLRPEGVADGIDCVRLGAEHGFREGDAVIVTVQLTIQPPPEKRLA